MSGTLAESLRGKRRVHLDSVTAIYMIEKHALYQPIIRPVFELVGAGILQDISSYLTLLEAMIQPLRSGRVDLAREYRDTLVQSRNKTLFPVDREIAEQGAAIRAKYGSFKTPDDIQLATAIRREADAFVTNDKELKRCGEVQVLVLDEYLRPGPGTADLDHPA